MAYPVKGVLTLNTASSGTGRYLHRHCNHCFRLTLSHRSSCVQPNNNWTCVSTDCIPDATPLLVLPPHIGADAWKLLAAFKFNLKWICVGSDCKIHFHCCLLYVGLAPKEKTVAGLSGGVNIVAASVVFRSTFKCCLLSSACMLQRL